MIRLGLIGSGKIANAHASAVEALSDETCVRAVIDPRMDAASALAHRLGAMAFPSAEALRADASLCNELDAMLVCTPPSSRVSLIETCVEMGWSVLCEKPLAHRAADSRTLASMAERTETLVCAAGLCHRFTPAVDAIAELVREGKTGPIVRIENVFAAKLGHIAEHWMSDPAVSGGGSLLDAGTHSIDLMHHLVGSCEVAGATLDHPWPGRGDGNATVLLRSLGGGLLNAPAGVACSIATGWDQPTRFDLRVVGRDGSLYYDFEDAHTLQFVGSDGATETFDVPSHEIRFTEQLRAFVRSVEQGKLVSPLASFADANRVMLVLQSIPGALHPLTDSPTPTIVADTDTIARGRRRSSQSEHAASSS